MNSYTGALTIGSIAGFLMRVRMLRTDYRQYPTYLHGKIIHLSIGFIAAGIGAVAVPALLEKEYTAITFLALAAQQFREVRKMERETLSKLDESELVPRGASYIEGIAMVFEGRNYLVIISAFLTSLATVAGNSWVGLGVGVALFIVAGFLRLGKYLEEIADISRGELRMEGPSLYVDDIYLMNIGLEENRQKILKKGVGVIVSPKNQDSRITLSNIGQRQAILYDVSVILGVFRDTGEPSLVPLSKRSLGDGRLGLLFLPEVRDPEKVLQIVRRVPVLESAIRMPTEEPKWKGKQG
ncbi:YIEGIA family protein [Salinithrix halophila]|uniref:YIEGIA family protein n=1 Tax=Salinithrix halophila TaxID=1485204 RepID=A0ABV8JHV6_9BACL